MKKIVLTMVALLSMTAMMAQSENAERKAPKQVTPAEMTANMAKTLNLTEEQTTKVGALNEEYKDYLRGPRMGGGRPPKADAKTGATPQEGKGRPELTDEQKAKMKEHRAKREEYDKKLQQVLTADQYKSWKKQHGRHGRHGHHGGPRGGMHHEKVND